jgi:hypothetical protein
VVPRLHWWACPVQSTGLATPGRTRAWRWGAGSSGRPADPQRRQRHRSSRGPCSCGHEMLTQPYHFRLSRAGDPAPPRSLITSPPPACAQKIITAAELPQMFRPKPIPVDEGESVDVSQPSNLNPKFKPLTLNPQPSTLHPQPQTPNPQP